MSTSKPSNPYGQIGENNHIGFPRIAPAVFSPHECEQIIKPSEILQLEESGLGYGETNSRVDLFSRSSKVKWMEADANTTWIYERLRDTMGSDSLIRRPTISIRTDIEKCTKES